MDSGTAAFATVGAVATAAYINAKLHVGKDLNTLLRLKRLERSTKKAFQEGRASLFYLFEDACNKYPDLLAIWSRDGCYTRRETYRRVCQYGNYFLSLGIKPDELVALYHTNAPEFLFMWLGLWSIGCAPAMINYNLAEGALVHCVKIAHTKVLMVDQDKSCQQRVQVCAERLETEAGAKIIILDDALKAKIAQGDASRPSDTLRSVASNPLSTIGLIYTSGTTGLPKAFAFETARAHSTTTMGIDVWKLQPGKDVFYVCMPMYHGTGGLVAIGRMMDGITLAIGKKFSASTFWKDIRESEATGFVYVGEVARYLLAAPPSPLDKQHKLKMMYGNGMRPDVWQKFQERFGIAEVGEFFSSTEGMLNLAIYSRSGLGVGTVGHHGVIFRTMLHNRYVPVAIDQTTGDMWRDPQTGFAKRTKYREGGEVLVRVESTKEWPGYYKADAATGKKFIHDVFRKGDLFYRPGDALRRDNDGFWYFMDRLGDTFRWKGENVSTAEVSDVISRHPSIHEANVYGVTLPNHDGRAGCAAVSLSSSVAGNPDWKSIADHARASLPRYAVPVFLRLVKGEAGSMGTHNYKQDKMPYREEGVDPSMRGTKLAKGAADEFYWLHPQAEAYVPFTEEHWNEIATGKLRL